MKLDLQTRTALITGGATGVGFGIAQELVQEGASVILCARRQAVLDEARARLGDIRTIALDLSVPGAALQLAQEAGDIDILVNSAGASHPIGIGGAEADWAAAYQLRVAGLRQLVEALLPGMRERRYGRIINIGGGFEVQAMINTASVMNAARTVWSKSLSNMVAADGVTVNTIALGFIRSEQMARGPAPVPESAIPAGHYGDPADVGALAALLASPRGRYITGEVIAVDGGFHRFAF